MKGREGGERLKERRKREKGMERRGDGQRDGEGRRGSIASLMMTEGNI